MNRPSSTMTDSSTIPLAEYIFRRLASLGIEHVFGVPGDFNLHLLDQIYNVPELAWQGCCNELNAACAADGYARIKGTPAALITTYGVGELSAMNGVAGAYAEHAGMIHIVGMTARPVQEKRLMIHHTLEPGMDHATFIGMSEPIRKTHCFLTNDATMGEEVDRVMEAAVRSRLPVFIYVPMDVVKVPIQRSRLDKPLDGGVKNDEKAEDAVVSKVLELIKKASKPTILADLLALRHGGKGMTRKLAELTRFPSYTTPLSKGVIEESKPYFNGVYNGAVSFPGVAAGVEGSDLVLNIGPFVSDSNSGGFTRKIDDAHLAYLGHEYCQIAGEKYDGVHFLPVLEKVVKELEANSTNYNLPHPSTWSKVETPILSSKTSGPLEQSFVWQRIGKFLQPHDIVIAEAGTAQFGMPDATFPEDVSWITQIFWSSIGYSVGATLGALTAAREMKHKGRVILLVGEGSLQMSVQEIGSYIRFGYTPVIFLINNNGYSIERAINGPKQTYNDINMMWDHQKMLEFFGARGETGIKSSSVACRTVEELETVLTDGEFKGGEYIRVRSCYSCDRIFLLTLDSFAKYSWISSTTPGGFRRRLRSPRGGRRYERSAFIAGCLMKGFQCKLFFALHCCVDDAI